MGEMALLQAYFKGLTFYLHEPWLLAYTLLIAVSLLDWTVSVSLLCVEVGMRKMTVETTWDAN